MSSTGACVAQVGELRSMSWIAQDLWEKQHTAVLPDANAC